MCDRLLLKTSLEWSKHPIKLRRLNDRPRHDVKFSTMQLGNEVVARLISYYLSELQGESTNIHKFQEEISGKIGLTHSRSPLYQNRSHPWLAPVSFSANTCKTIRTLIMITRVDWNNEGFASGSSTFVQDWKPLECVSNEASVFNTPNLERICNVSRKGKIVPEQHLVNVSTNLEPKLRAYQIWESRIE